MLDMSCQARRDFLSLIVFNDGTVIFLLLSIQIHGRDKATIRFLVRLRSVRHIEANCLLTNND